MRFGVVKFIVLLCLAFASHAAATQSCQLFAAALEVVGARPDNARAPSALPRGRFGVAHVIGQHAVRILCIQGQTLAGVSREPRDA